MTKKNLHFLCSVLYFAFLFGNANAQKAGTKDYAAYPYWIAMMKDTNTNYFEAVKAFNAYWAGRENPQSENDKFAGAGKEEDKTKSKNAPYSFEYKKFQHWQMQIKPYVQDNGSILYPYQRRQLRQNARSANPSNTAK